MRALFLADTIYPYFPTKLFNVCFSFSLLLTALFTGGPAVAEEKRDGVENAIAQSVHVVRLPKSLPKLPSPRARDSRFYLSRANVQDFKEYLLAPIVSWIEAGLFASRAFARLDYQWTLLPEWERQSRLNADKYLLKDDFSLGLAEGSSPSAQGLPFGHLEEIDSESDPVKKAYKILWSIQYLQAAPGDILYEGELTWFGTQDLLRRASGIIYRDYSLIPEVAKSSGDGVQEPGEASTKELEVGGGDAQSNSSITTELAEAPRLPETNFSTRGDFLYREVFQLAFPPVVQGYAQIFWRSRGAFEDQGWLHSPVIGKSRRLLGANRSDSILGGELTTDDLFVWSAAPASVYARVAAEKVLFVPFPSLSQYSAERMTYGENVVLGSGSDSSLPAASGAQQVLSLKGFHQRRDGGPTTVVYNGENRSLPGLAPWVPLTMVMVPRRVWIIEISPRDPAYLAGRQVLVVDKESLLPVYKVVYDRKGEYQRLVLGAWSLAVGAKGEARFPFSSFVLAVDRGAGQAMSFTTDFARSFLGEESEAATELRGLLSIEAHEEARREQPSVKGSVEK